MPKITEKDFGKKMRLDFWHPERSFIPLAFYEHGIVGIQGGYNAAFWPQEEDKWIPYEEAKKDCKK